MRSNVSDKCRRDAFTILYALTPRKYLIATKEYEGLWLLVTESETHDLTRNADWYNHWSE